MTERYQCVPLISDRNHVSMIRDFVVDREEGLAEIPDKIIGLESYLKRAAWQDDHDEQVRIYLVDDFYMPLQPGYDGGCRFMYRIRYSSEG